MKFLKLFFVISVVCFSITGCCRNSCDVWEDTKTASRHMGRGFRSLSGKHGDSRQVRCRDDFCVQTDYDYEPEYYSEEPTIAMQENDFIPLQDEAGNNLIAMENIRQPRETPGERGSTIPSAEHFQDPLANPNLSSVYQPIQFDYNSDLIKGQNNLNTIRNIADYMKRNNNMYVFIEGHCDERGPEAYNLALGARRSNAVRNLLMKEGVSPDNIFTISYGKEKPLVVGHDENAWSINRRAQFKTYER